MFKDSPVTFTSVKKAESSEANNGSAFVCHILKYIAIDNPPPQKIFHFHGGFYKTQETNSDQKQCKFIFENISDMQRIRFI